MKGKKFVALVMGTVLGMSMMAGCGSKTDAPAESQPETEAVSEAVTPETETQAVSSDDPMEAITEGYYTYGLCIYSEVSGYHSESPIKRLFYTVSHDCQKFFIPYCNLLK